MNGTRLACLALVAVLPCAARAQTPIAVQLGPVDPNITSPNGLYRWMDAADQLYAAAYGTSYSYAAASVTVSFFTDAATLHGSFAATGLKPNFAYQFKVMGKPEAAPADNERVGFAGRWWQQIWQGTAWDAGWNLNDKGDGSSPNPNDATYLARRDVLDATSPTGRKYRYTAYLVFDYFITDDSGAASFAFEADDCYHVLWKPSQHPPAADDGPVRSRSFAVTLPDPAGAYDSPYAQTTAGIFGEWERLPPGGVTLPEGDYTVDFLLTEECFHGGGLAGGWAAAMGADAAFTIIPEPTTILLLAAGALVTRRCRRRACRSAAATAATGTRA